MIVPGYLAAAMIHGIRLRELQLQPAGVDLTVAEVHGFASGLVIGFEFKKVARSRPLPPVNGSWDLRPGAYKVVFNEVVEVPRDAAGICLPRSSLVRSGVLVSCALWDPGYRGRGEAMLLVANPHGTRLQVGARVAQMVFIKLSGAPHKLYDGEYQGERLDGR